MLVKMQFQVMLSLSNINRHHMQFLECGTNK